MENKDIILQVDEETASIMEDISEQLFDETDARFDEVIQKLESLSKLNDVSAKNVTEVKTKSEQIISSTKDMLTILQELAKDEASASDMYNTILNYFKKSKEEFQENDSKMLLLETSNSEQIKEILVKLNDVSAEHVSEVKTKSEQIISSTKDILNILQESILQKLAKGEANTSDTYNAILNYFKESKEEFQENDSKMLLLETSNSEQLKEILVKFNDFNESIDKLSSSVKNIAEQQDIIIKKHCELEKDIKYLKMPFYKRWFAKGED